MNRLLPKPAGVVALAILVLAGCSTRASHRSSSEDLRQSLPLILNRTDRVTALLDAVVVKGAIVSVGEFGTIVRSEDSGRSWAKSPSSVQSTLTGVTFAGDGEHGWAVGHDAIILATTDGGLTWKQQWQGEDRAAWFLGVVAMDERRAIAVGTNGLYAETSNGGDTWTARKIIAEAYHLNRIAEGSSGLLYIVGERGTILRSEDEGKIWTAFQLPDPESLYGVLPLGRRSLFVYGAGMSGRVYHSDDNAKSWSATRIAPHFVAASAVRLVDGTILLAGWADYWQATNLGSYFVSRDGGRTFAPWRLKPQELGMVKLLQAPDRSLLAFGKDGVTELSSP